MLTKDEQTGVIWHTSNFTTTTGKMSIFKSKDIKLHVPIVITGEWFSNSQHLTVKLQNLSPCRHDVKGHVGDVGNKLTRTDACFVRLLCSWAQVQSSITTLNFSIEVDRNDDSVILFVPIVCDHVFLQHLSNGKDQHFLARIIYPVDVLYSHEVRILVPDLMFSHVISGQMDRPLLPLIDLDFFLQLMRPCIFSLS